MLGPVCGEFQLQEGGRTECCSEIHKPHPDVCVVIVKMCADVESSSVCSTTISFDILSNQFTITIVRSK